MVQYYPRCTFDRTPRLSLTSTHSSPNTHPLPNRFAITHQRATPNSHVGSPIHHCRGGNPSNVLPCPRKTLHIRINNCTYTYVGHYGSLLRRETPKLYGRVHDAPRSVCRRARAWFVAHGMLAAASRLGSVVIGVAFGHLLVSQGLVCFVEYESAA